MNGERRRQLYCDYEQTGVPFYTCLTSITPQNLEKVPQALCLGNLGECPCTLRQAGKLSGRVAPTMAVNKALESVSPSNRQLLWQV